MPVSGTVSVDNSTALIEKLWSRPVKAWFPGGSLTLTWLSFVSISMMRNC